jgi:hypothetical protein
VPTPPKQLAGFAKVNLDPRDRERVTVTLDRHALSYWDEAADRWVTPRGRVRVYVGSSVEDIRLAGSVRIGEFPGGALPVAVWCDGLRARRASRIGGAFRARP